MDEPVTWWQMTFVDERTLPRWHQNPNIRFPSRLESKWIFVSSLWPYASSWKDFCLVGPAGEPLSAGGGEQMSLLWTCFKAKRHQLHPPHRRSDVEQGSHSFGLARGYWIITDAFGVTVRPQVWRVLIIYLIACMCWLINLKEICRINYPIIPL